MYLTIKSIWMILRFDKLFSFISDTLNHLHHIDVQRKQRQQSEFRFLTRVTGSMNEMTLINTDHANIFLLFFKSQ